VKRASALGPRAACYLLDSSAGRVRASRCPQPAPRRPGSPTRSGASLLRPVTSLRRIAPVTLSPLRRVVVTAPMRVSLAGGGTDLAPFFPGVGGRIVGTAVDLRVRAVVEPFDHGWVRLELSATNTVVTRRRDEPPRHDVPLRLLEAALAEVGLTGGVRLRLETDVVPGAGLGGSGAAAVAALAALDGSLGAPITRDALARRAQSLEQDRLHLACGPQDPYFAAFGGLVDLRFDDTGALTQAASLGDPTLVAALSAGMLLVDTGQRRVSGEALARVPRSAEVTAELVAAAGDVARGLDAGSLAAVIAGMQRSAAAKLRRDPVGNAAAAALGAQLAEHSAEVVRVCGAGAGGHVLVWAAAERHAAILAAVGGTVRRPSLCAEGVREEAA
jgi:D-glycero-alpha-D-manno-heptose-7-phosphate kinase